MHTVRMLGTRGIPAAHGGFETAAENIARELARRGWRVVVYCQTEEPTPDDEWEGVERIHLPGRFAGAAGTMWFDAQAVRHASRHEGVCLTFGYNTAVLNVALKARRRPQVVNMDGIEWKRARWSRGERAFLYLNERAACRLGDALIADHPEIRRHLLTRAPAAKITTIPYGAPEVCDAPLEPLKALGLESGRFCTLIARPVEENSVLELVRGWSSRPRQMPLVVLGAYDRDDPFHRQVLDAAGEEVRFPGAIYDQDVVRALRFHSRAYLHGHTVGGTNPSLVEALGCGNPVIAHDNVYNRWVAGDAAAYFDSTATLEDALTRVLDQSSGLVEQMSKAARARHAEAFDWGHITDQYEELLLAHVDPGNDPPD